MSGFFRVKYKLWQKYGYSWKIEHISKDNLCLQLNLCAIIPKMLLSNLIWVRVFNCFRYGYNKHLNFRLMEKKLTWEPQVQYFTDRSKAVLLLWIFYVFSVLSLLCLCARLFICALWSLAGKGLTSWLSFVVSNC